MAANREKFATQVKSEILSAVRALAEIEGRQLQALVDEESPDEPVAVFGERKADSAWSGPLSSPIEPKKLAKLTSIAKASHAITFDCTK